MSRNLFAGCLLTVLIGAPLGVQAGVWTQDFEMECGPRKHRLTPEPQDYRRASSNFRNVVEMAHFTVMVDKLIRPMFRYFGSDISYTLHAMPNHPRALDALARLTVREKTDQPAGLPYTADCFFRRAVLFAPDDNVARMLYAQYLTANGRKDRAIEQLAVVEARLGDNPLTYYNLGMQYLGVGRFDKALDLAHRAAAMGLERQELRQRLVSAGQWREPEKPAVPAAAAASEPAASRP